MKQGTQGFQGLRLAQAREVRGLSQAELATILGIKRQAVSAYEVTATFGNHDGLTPSPELLRRIVSYFGLSKSFFTKSPINPDTTLATLFRQKKKVAIRRRTRIQILAEWSYEMIYPIETVVMLPSVNLPERINDPNQINPVVIKSMAEKLRQIWGLELNQPITNLIRWLEANGVIVVSFDFQDDQIDGFTTEFNGRPYIFINKRIRSASRQLMTLAHEIGHILLHSFITKDSVSLEYDELTEGQAFAFARFFLMPEQAFLQDIYQLRRVSLDNLKMLKIKWKTSIASMIEHLAHLNIITYAERTALYKNISRREWKLVEPFDETMKQDHPTVIKKAFDMISKSEVYKARDVIEKSGFGSSQALEILDIDLDELEPILGVKQNDNSMIQFNTANDKPLF